MPSLESGWEEQWELQRVLHGYEHPTKRDDAEKIVYIKDMILALEDELHEAMQEIGWKPWATSRHINREAYLSELVDAWQFLMNLFQVVGATPEEVANKLYQKHMVNWRRIRDGYTGLKKCRHCGRAFDDVHATCTPELCGEVGV